VSDVVMVMVWLDQEGMLLVGDGYKAV